MSGGYFNYLQYRVEDIALDIDDLIETNDSIEKDEYNQEIGRHYPADIIAKFDETRKTLRLAGAMAHRIDWLVSGDDGEDSFRERWGKEIEPLRAS